MAENKAKKKVDVEWSNMSPATERHTMQGEWNEKKKKNWNSIRWISGDKIDSNEGNMTLNWIKKQAAATTAIATSNRIAV